MSPVTNARVLFNSIPDGFPEPGKTTVSDTSEKIDLENVPLYGGYLVKILELSVDPYLRGRMRAPEIESYAPTVLVGKPLDNFGVAVVLRSESSEMVQYQVLPANSSVQKLENPHKLPWSTFIGVLGMPGQTAYTAWKEFSAAKKAIFVSTGAGPVGSMVIQLAKLDGLRVIGSAGSDEKVQFMKDIGADVAFNYKTAKTSEVLAKQKGIDIFLDNVGGETLDAALEAAKVDARNRNMHYVFAKSITLYGFTVLRLLPKYKVRFYEEISSLVVSWKIKHREQVWDGLDKVGEAILAVQKGHNKAKAVVHVADD
ncbi:hypothetical protein D9619_012537 [Psilocybe cf. subviscida]|uniref:Enoyl reductase (ER) domain-containing protein n=1 Tax=Psilocybe cf. subviscida TaxID=2480587 RepID=A0A8H5B8R0_9AGAR|nr:hypothetical protein D9619_012537 [Psilocybe cf. subviscida]